MIQELHVRTISPKMMAENPLRLRHKRNREIERQFDAEKKRNIFLQLPAQSLPGDTQQSGERGNLTKEELTLQGQQVNELLVLSAQGSLLDASTSSLVSSTLEKTLDAQISTPVRKENAFGRLTRELKERQKARGEGGGGDHTQRLFQKDKFQRFIV